MDLKRFKWTRPIGWAIAFLALVVSPCLAQVASPNCQHEYHWLEAECGTVMSPGELGRDPEASDGGYLTTPAGAGRFINNVAGPLIASYDYTLDYDCHQIYYLWARVKFDSSLHNSLWVSFDQSGDFPWLFSDQATGYWHWKRLGSITGLWRGDHKLFIKLREEQAQVDKLLMTSDPLYSPEGLGEPAENRCISPTPGDSTACDLCDPKINLGDLVVLRDPYFPNDPFNGWPAIVVGKNAGNYALLTHRELTYRAPYAMVQGPQGQGYPYNQQQYRVSVPNTDASRYTIIVPERSVEQYLDCRGLLSFNWNPQRGTYTGAFRSDAGWSGDIEIMPGVVPSGISAGDNPNMRLQGMLHASENTVYYPLISSTLRPLAREGEVVIREILNNPFPEANTYGLGVVECWNLDRSANAKIISLTDLVGSVPPPLRGADGGFAPPTTPPSDSERLSCITVHLRPAVFDFTETGSFISYVCSDCGVIRRIDSPHTKFPNGRLGDSDFALVFEQTRECYVLPEGIQYGTWADLVGKPYRLAGFQQHADPAGTGFGQVKVDGINYRRLGFLAAPVAAMPCGDAPSKQYNLNVSSTSGGHVTPSEGSFTLDEGTQVTLTAVADAGYTFDGWTLTGLPAATLNPSSPTLSFVMNGDYAVLAKFRRIQVPVSYTLWVSSGSGGHVTPAEGTFTYNQGTVVTLTARPDAGYVFDGWTTTGIPSGTVNVNNATVSFTMQGNYVFQAHFKRVQPTTYTLTVSSDTGGHVSPAEGTFTYNPGTWVALTAVADAGYAFDGWTATGLPAGTINASNPVLWFPVNGNYTLHARFKRINTPVTYTLRVTSNPFGEVKPAEGTFTYNQGTSVTLTAVPRSGYVFDQWITTGIPTGAIDRRSATVTFAMNGNYAFYASFKAGPAGQPNLTDGGLLYQDIHPQVVYRGGTVNVSFRLMNTGTATAQDTSGYINIAYFASTDTQITLADYPLGDEYTWALAAGQSRDITVPLLVPSSLPSGNYYVGWIIDPGKNIQESNENDNVAFKQSKKLFVQ